MFQDFHNIVPEREELSLRELNNRIQGAINRAFPSTCWVRAEMSDVRTNASSGHCYLEFIEKSPINGQLIAKARGTIWAKTFRMLKPYFESETGQAFTSGLKVLVNVSVEFHEVYGFSLTVQDIDPAYTVGDMVRRKMEIIRKLQEEGVFTLNKELAIPTLPQRIAVVTSPTAAGYEDFLDQLLHNKQGYPFYVKLFPAIMQGEKTEESIINALDNIYNTLDNWDVVVIIRGGGSTSDLNCFDSYLLAANCAQFPLPIITGIGHERDDTIVDMIAHTRMKTPTAVAEFLIRKMGIAAEELVFLQEKLCGLANAELTTQKNFLQLLGNRFPVIVSNRIERNRTMLHSLVAKLPSAATSLFSKNSHNIDLLQSRLSNGVSVLLTEKKRTLQLNEQYIKMASPQYILQRGYTLSLKDGKIIKKAVSLKPGDQLTTRFADGDVQSIVE